MKIALSLLLGALMASSVMAGQDELAELMERIRAAEADYKTAFNDMTVTQKMVTLKSDGSSGTEADVTMYVKGDKMRMEVDIAVDEDEPPFMAGPVITISDGEAVHIKAPIVGWQAVAPGSKEARQSQGQNDWHAFINDNATLAGYENVDGIDCAVLLLDSTLYGQDSKAWIDTEKLVAVKTAINAGGTMMVSRYSDYRKAAGGILYPYSVSVTMNGKPSSRMTVTSLKTDTGLDDALFIPGKGGVGTACGGCCLLGIKETVKSVIDMTFGGI